MCTDILARTLHQLNIILICVIFSLYYFFWLKADITLEHTTNILRTQLVKFADTDFEQSMLSMFDNKKATNLTQKGAFHLMTQVDTNIILFLLLHWMPRRIEWLLCRLCH